MDLLYILGKGSIFHDDELRYSLRSVERYVTDVDRVFVVGDDPGFLSNKVNYHYVEEATGNKEYCIAKKIEWACANVLEGDFLFMNDDFFFTQTVTAAGFPYYCKGSLLERVPDPRYGESLRNTYHYLKEKRLQTDHYDVHTPIIYNTKKFLALEPVWWISRSYQFGFVVKSIYSNTYKVKKQLYHDVKLNHLKSARDFERVAGTCIFSCSDQGWMKGVANYVKSKFKTKSKYEI